MYELIKSGGWLMLPLILCSILAFTIILERFWSLRNKRVIPEGLLEQVQQWMHNKQCDAKQLASLKRHSPLGSILAAAISPGITEHLARKDNVEATGRHVLYKLERNLNFLGTIAEITPLLGLLGTVVGMVHVFAAIMSQGVGNPQTLAGGISEALITTAAGLSVAIPSLMFYRYFNRRIEDLTVQMEQSALKLVNLLHNETISVITHATPAEPKDDSHPQSEQSTGQR